MSKNSQEYWMTWDAEDLAGRLIEHHKLYMQNTFNPVYQMWVRNNYAYYSTVLDTQAWWTSLNFEGEQGELVKMSIPQARSLIRQMVTLLTKQKLAFNAVARVQDSDVTESMRIANAIAVDAVQKQNLDEKQEWLCERSLVQGTAFIKTCWRSDLGKPRVVEKDEQGNERVLYDGDVEVSLPTVFDMIYDFTLETWEQQQWAECRVKRNRWDLIAQHPGLKTEILKLPSVNDDYRTSLATLFDDRDMVYVYEMFHKPTPSLPQGRMLVYADTKTIFYDDVNPYGCIPIEPLIAERIDGLCYGYAALSNLLPAQEMFDHSYSCLATNQSSLGVANVIKPTGANINVQSLYGMNFIDYTPVANAANNGKPEVLDLLNSPGELFKLPEVLKGEMQQLSFINAAVRGELPASTSGVAIATLTTNALEFLSSYSKSLKICMEKTMMHIVNAYRRFAKVERLVAITGKNYQTFARQFTGDILDPIHRIEMVEINPLMQTLAGRIDIAEKAIEKGLVKDMQAYVSILDGQPMNKLYDTELSENDLIQSENERLSTGQTVIALSVDKHAQHIYKHKTLLNDPMIRLNSPMVAAIEQHILQHLELQKMTDPMLMAMASTGLVPEGMPPPPPGDMMVGGNPEMLPAPSPADAQGANPGNFAVPMETPAEEGMPTIETAQPAQDMLGR
jgi:hypothetical protein